MKPLDLRSVDPRTLHLPPSRSAGVDPVKLHMQLSRFGTSTVGMPHVEVYEDPDGRLLIWNGVTRATRIAKFLPGTPIIVNVVGKFKNRVGHYPTVGDKLP
jgi:hypothetical protein